MALFALVAAASVVQACGWGMGDLFGGGPPAPPPPPLPHSVEPSPLPGQGGPSPLPRQGGPSPPPGQGGPPPAQQSPPSPAPQGKEKDDSKAPTDKGASTWKPNLNDTSKARKHICDGKHVERQACVGIPNCPPCLAEDCVWSAWSEWTPEKGCTQLKERTRSPKALQTSCADGKSGKPCEGAITETALLEDAEVPEECQGEDCKFSDWSEWTNCTNSQQMRSRIVEQLPKEGGQLCSGSLKETQACGKGASEDCEFANWDAWTDCSATCGQGRWTRMRRIATYAEGGTTCDGPTLEEHPCSVFPCAGKDCVLSEWSEWEGSCSPEDMQRIRRREIEARPEGSGRPCDQTLVETEGCWYKPQDCTVSLWSAWSDCDSFCGPGQRSRNRDILDVEVKGGLCPEILVRQMEPCHNMACEADNMHDCRWKEWSFWSECAATCGYGTALRSREIGQLAANGGSPCSGPLSEAKACQVAECKWDECQWDDWEDWSECSLTCGGGSQTRKREIEVLPTGPSSYCEANSKMEVQACKTESCGEGCIDGKWGEWADWKEWSATCGPAFRSRARLIATEANSCGKAVTGIFYSYENATLDQCGVDQDCTLSPWSSWSECSASCSGVNFRQRHVLIPAAGIGKKCEEDAKGAISQLAPCNPGVGEQQPLECQSMVAVDCIMGEWEEWTQCTATCGSAERTRSRRPFQYAADGGKPCDGALLIAEACKQGDCPVAGAKNCEWTQWGEWGHCSGCHGEKSRSRHPHQLPSYGGKPCLVTSAKEIADCEGDCPNEVYCAWTEWTEGIQDCDVCGTNTRSQTRALGYRKKFPDTGSLFDSVDKSAKCSGHEVKYDPCNNPFSCQTCHPVDCQFGPWTDWEDLVGLGLCQRERAVNQSNNECGEPCFGTLIDTTSCPNMDQNRCELSDWTNWEDTCSLKGKELGQRNRHRSITKIGGMGCAAPLNETQGCNKPKPIECIMGEWAKWTDCDAGMCSYGYQTRDRPIGTYAQAGGDRCNAVFKESRTCKVWAETCGPDEPRDCDLGPWSNWTECDLDGQRYSDRKIVQEAYKGGAECFGPLHKTETCRIQKNCTLSPWTAWSECDAQCGNGQTHRQRQVVQLPENSGAMCEPELMETKGCFVEMCDSDDATLSDWAEWSECSVDCGEGVMFRSRDVDRIRKPGGKGITDILAETRVCTAPVLCEAKDCKLGSWSAWSACSAVCGPGIQDRIRDIVQKTAHNGHQCPSADNNLKEAKGCMVKSCGTCIDGEWAEWKDWSTCSATCGGGTLSRTRTEKTKANECGQPAVGKDHKIAFCNLGACEKDGDCEMTAWTEWTGCSATCDGHQSRSREVLTASSGGGTSCTGSTAEAQPCNPVLNGPRPAKCKPPATQDCVPGPWEAWSTCSTSCRGGTHQRSRPIKQYSKNGGQPCKDGLQQIKECNRNISCSAGKPKPVDCKLGPWEKWGECSAETSDRTRWRKIKEEAKDGGICELGDLQEIGGCTPSGPQKTQTCEWQTWGDWKQCSVTCGSSGIRERDRTLLLKTKEEEEVKRKLSELQQEDDVELGALRLRAKELQAQGPGEFAAAFLAGAGAVLVLAIGVSAVAGRFRPSSPIRPSSPSMCAE